MLTSRDDGETRCLKLRFLTPPPLVERRAQPVVFVERTSSWTRRGRYGRVAVVSGGSSAAPVAASLSIKRARSDVASDWGARDGRLVVARAVAVASM